MSDDNFIDLFRQEGQEIIKLANTISNNDVLKLVEKIKNCKGNILLTGCGTSKLSNFLCK